MADTGKIIALIKAFGGADPAVIKEAVSDWLDDHPEATTTVEDGAITEAKLNDSLKGDLAWQDDLDELKSAITQEKAPVILDTATGEIVTIPDGADGLDVKTLTVAIEPVQSGSGDPSPDNVRPISGWTGANVERTGKNLAPKGESGSKHSITFTVASDGKVTTSGTAGGSSSYVLGEVKLFANTQYVLSGCASGGSQGKYGLGLLSYDESTALATDFGSGETYTPTSDITAKVAIRYWYGQAVSGVFTPQLEIGSAPSAYVAYSGQTKTYTFPTPPGTVYGGTLTVNADGTGKLVVDRVKKTFDGSESWGFYRSDGSTEYNAYSTNKATAFNNVSVLEAWSGSTKANAICDYFKCDGDVAYYHNASAFAMSANDIIMSTNVANSVAGWEEYLSNNNITIVAKLTTPITYELSALEVIELLKGVNNLWADCGNVSIEYPCDTKLYVDKKIMEAIANALNA